MSERKYYKVIHIYKEIESEKRYEERMRKKEAESQ